VHLNNLNAPVLNVLSCLLSCRGDLLPQKVRPHR